jgi:hypothetical protein
VLNTPHEKFGDMVKVHRIGYVVRQKHSAGGGTFIASVEADHGEQSEKTFRGSHLVPPAGQRDGPRKAQ